MFPADFGNGDLSALVNFGKWPTTSKRAAADPIFSPLLLLESREDCSGVDMFTPECEQQEIASGVARRASESTGIHGLDPC